MLPLERGRVGVVEDDPVMGGTLVHRLQLEGHVPCWWRTGQEAIEAFHRTRPDLVVCDIGLPDMSGEEVYLRSPPPLAGTPFVFVTAFGQIEQAVRLAKAGAVNYIVKPYALSALLDQIGQLILRRPGITGALGNSQPMRDVEALLRQVANLDTTLLFTGESGV